MRSARGCCNCPGLKVLVLLHVPLRVCHVDAMASWDDDAFELPTLPGGPADDEERFVHPPTQAEQLGAEEAESFPAMLVDLAPLAAVDERLRTEYEAVRSVVLSALQDDWSAKSGELMQNNLCWHAPRSESAAFRLAYEAAHPGSMLSVIEYPESVDGVRSATLWGAVTRPTPWEVVDILKHHVAHSRRPLKFMADLALELEDLADAEERKAETVARAQAALEAAVAMKQTTLAAMQAAHARKSEAAVAHDAPTALVDLADAGALPTHRSVTPAASADDVTRMLAQLDLLDAQIEEKRSHADEVLHEAAESSVPVHSEGEGGSGGVDDEPAADVPSLVDILLDVIFEQYDDEPGLEPGLEPAPIEERVARTAATSWMVRAIAISQRKCDLRRMWASTFGGRLPAASALVLKHAGLTAQTLGARRTLPGRGETAGRPRMRVPPPVMR